MNANDCALRSCQARSSPFTRLRAVLTIGIGPDVGLKSPSGCAAALLNPAAQRPVPRAHQLASAAEVVAGVETGNGSGDLRKGDRWESREAPR